MRYALRALLRTPAFTAIAIVTLAVGIGTNTTIFAIVDELAFKPTRGTWPADVYSVREIAIPDYDTLLANRPAGVEAIAAFDSFGGLLQTPGRAEYVSGMRVSGAYAGVQRLRAQAGRWISDDDNVGGELDPKVVARGQSRPIVLGQLGQPVCVISDRIWREWFNAVPDIADRVTLALNHTPMRVVGVAPARFDTGIDIWTPFGHRRLLTRAELDAQRPKKAPVGWVGPLPEPTQPQLQVLIRTAAGVDARVVTDRLKAALAARPTTNDMPASVIRLGKTGGGDIRLVSTGYTILGFAALIFVAACANLGNMLFARATEREGELAVRLALGATRLGVFNLLFFETLLICAAASAAGLLFTAGVLHLFTDAFPAFQVNYWRRIALDLSIDWRIAAYATAAGLVAALVVGAGSLWRASRVSLLSRLAASSQAVVAKTEGRTVRTMLVSVQVTAAVLLLIATGMLLENTSRRLNLRLQFDTSALVSATLTLPDGYDESRGQHFFSQLLARTRSIDGVTAAAFTDALPGSNVSMPSGGVSSAVAEAPERGLSGVPRRLDGRWLHVSPGFLDVLGLKLIRGRDFLETDEAGSEPVALVSESAARRLWAAGEDPIGRRLRCCGETSLRRVVGLVPDPIVALDKPATFDIGEAMSEQSAGSGPGAFVLLPAAQRYRASMLLVLRSDAPRAAIQPLRDAVVALDPAVPVFDAGPADATQFGGKSLESAVRLLAGALGLIALGIAVLGVYAIVSYYVTRRAREFGLRLALGSTRRQIVKLVIDYAIHVVLIGLLPGVLLASLGTRYFQAELRELHPNGLTVWGFVPVLMLVAGVVAAYLPARRAARVEPYKALKDL